MQQARTRLLTFQSNKFRSKIQTSEYQGRSVEVIAAMYRQRGICIYNTSPYVRSLAGSKKSGGAAVILSQPTPRWTSKHSSQGITWSKKHLAKTRQHKKVQWIAKRHSNLPLRATSVVKMLQKRPRGRRPAVSIWNSSNSDA